MIQQIITTRSGIITGLLAGVSLLALSSAPGCGSDDSGGSASAGTGGSTAGTGGSGGTSAEGGSGGTSAEGGSAGTGGTSSEGGSGGTGGTTAEGGSAGAGGATGPWTFAGDDLNRSNSYADNSQMLNLLDKPTVVWVEHSGGAGAKVVASSWDGSTWTAMDPPAQGTATEKTTVHANGVPPTATVWQDKLYVGWDTEDSATGDQNTWVMIYDGTWTDAANITPTPATLPGHNLGWGLSLNHNDDKLVATYLAKKTASDGAEVRTQLWDGTAFGTETSLNTFGSNWTAWAVRSAVSPSGDVLRIALMETANEGDYRFSAFFNDGAPESAPSQSMMVDEVPQLDVAYWDETPVLALSEEKGISVYQHNGTTWERMGQGYLNAVTDAIQLLPCAPDLLVYDGDVYVAWAEAGSAMVQTNAGIQVRRWSGTDWEDLGTGIVHDPTAMIRTTTGPSLSVVGDELWLSFSEVTDVDRVYVAHRQIP